MSQLSSSSGLQAAGTGPLSEALGQDWDGKDPTNSWRVENPPVASCTRNMSFWALPASMCVWIWAQGSLHSHAQREGGAPAEGPSTSLHLNLGTLHGLQAEPSSKGQGWRRSTELLFPASSHPYGEATGPSLLPLNGLLRPQEPAHGKRGCHRRTNT